MKGAMLLTSLIAVAFFSLSTLGAGLRSRQAGGTGPAACPSATVLSTTTVTVNGIDITRSTLECPEPITTNTTSTPTLTKRLAPFSALDVRNPSECKTAAPECQCGVIAACGCTNNTLIKETPNPNDCEILVQAMSVIQTAIAPTFTVQPGQMEEVNFQSCGFFFVNNGLTRNPIEFCWDEFATWASLGNEGCFDTNDGTELECISENLEWGIEAIRIDSLDN